MEMHYKIVGRVLEIDGPRLEFTRRTSSGKILGWFQAHRDMQNFLGDVFRTTANTRATLEFLAGGRAVIGPSSVVRIVSPRKFIAIYDPDKLLAPQLLHASAHKLWDLIKNKQEEEFQIQTSGGVIGGIEG